MTAFERTRSRGRKDLAVETSHDGGLCFSSVIVYSAMLRVVTRRCLTRAPLGGAESAPPLLNFLNNSKTIADIDTKFCVPHPTSI